MEISTPTAMTPCDPLETQTLCSGNVRGQPPPPSRGGMRESRPCLPLPWEWNAHRGSSSSGWGVGRPSPAHGGGEAATGPSAGMSVHASFQEQQQQQKTSGAILASLLQVRTVDQFPGWNYVDFSPRFSYSSSPKTAMWSCCISALASARVQASRSPGC